MKMPPVVGYGYFLESPIDLRAYRVNFHTFVVATIQSQQVLYTALFYNSYQIPSI